MRTQLILFWILFRKIFIVTGVTGGSSGSTLYMTAAAITFEMEKKERKEEKEREREWESQLEERRHKRRKDSTRSIPASQDLWTHS